MPIDFDCERCSRTLRVPDGSVGKRTHCPACHQVQRVPNVAVAKRSSNRMHPTVAASDERLNIPCPNCKQLLSCPPELVGTRGQCRQCQHIFTISFNPAEAASQSIGPIFSCPACHQLFEGREAMRGRKGRCHACHTVFTIPIGETSSPSKSSPGNIAPTKSSPSQVVASASTLDDADILTAAGTPAQTPAYAEAPAQAGSLARRSKPTQLQPIASLATTLHATVLKYAPLKLLPKSGRAKRGTSKSTAIQPETLDAEPTPAEAPGTETLSAQTSTVKASDSATLEPVVVPAARSAEAGPPTSKLGKFKLPKRVKVAQAVLVGSTSPEAALLNPVALQRRARRTLGGATSRMPLPIRFTCAECHGLMEVPGTSAGMETACPFCQMVQAIPTRSSVGEGERQESSAAPPERLGEFGASPAALQNQWAAQSVTRRRSDLTIANVFQIAFESLFPSCVIALVHVAIVGLYAAVGLTIVFGILQLLRFIGLSSGGVQTAALICFGSFGLVSLAVAAWFSAAVRHMALQAVRRMPFDVGKALSPGEAYGVALIIVSALALLGAFLRAPEFVESVSPGAVGWLAVIWVLVLLPLILFAQALVSFAWFAALDGENSRDAIASSCRMVWNHLPVMIAIKLLTWAMTIPLAVLTLGFALVLPIYVNATLYNLARNVASAPLTYSTVKKIA